MSKSFRPSILDTCFATAWPRHRFVSFARTFGRAPVCSGARDRQSKGSKYAVSREQSSSIPQRGVPAPLVSAGRGAVTVAIYLLIFSVVAALIVRRCDLA